MGDDNYNPFTLPSDEEVFRLRDSERLQKSLNRERQSQLKVWEKSTSTAQYGRSTINSQMADDSSGKRQKARALVSAAKNVLGTDNGRKPEKENMAEFIAKKREMFLVQMSLDTKREEIRKLEEKAAMKEETLKKSEQMFEEDTIRFDTFLKENDKKAHDAIKTAEKETKRKQDKVGEIKRLNQAIQAVQSDISKHREALDDCLRFKEFVDSLTPEDFFEEEKLKKLNRQKDRREKKIQERLDEWENLKKQKLNDFNLKKEAEHEAMLARGVSKKKAAATIANMRPPKMPERPKVEEEPLVSSGEELGMYFTSPHQLIDMFTQLEEQNLFLIQNSQETEQTLEALRYDFAATRLAMNAKTETLNKTMKDLEQLIKAEDSKSKSLKKSVQFHSETKGPGGGSGGSQGQTELLDTLKEKVLEVYKRCGFDVSGGAPSTLFMLSELEAKLEDLLSAMATMPQDYVVKSEKAKDRQRRDRKRAELQAEQERIQEERNRKSNERSMMAPNKRLGRQVMFRSKPLTNRKSRSEQKEDMKEADEDEARFFRDD
jgi:hypothetical protein